MRNIIYLVILSAPASLFAETLNCPCKVVQVLAGDTVYILDQYKSSRKIWLAGIDAPQMNQPYGEQSTQNLIKLVLGKTITVEYTQRDRYGRIAGKLLHQGKDINLQQIKDGFAWHYKKNPNEQSGADRARYRNAQAETKRRRTGLWSSNSPIPPWEFGKGASY